MDQDHELWRTLRYAGKAQDKASVDTLMLKYRPIAPKPSTNGKLCVGETSTRRTKRKYVRVSKNTKATCRSKNGSRSNSTDPEIGREDIVTLQLLPERSTDQNNLDPTVMMNNLIIRDETLKTDTWLKFDGEDDSVNPVPVETRVTVESVNVGSCSHHVVWSKDEEVADALRKDTCPGFITDGLNRVVMVNEAYRRIVTGDGTGVGSGEVSVWLVVDETAAFWEYRAFTCKVKLEYTWRDTKYIKTVPCDVWKMEFGGFAWRLDTTQALTLWL